MQTITLEVEKRELKTQGQLNAMRREGWIPAVLYGGEKSGKKGSSLLLKVNEKAFLKAVGTQKRSNALVEIKIENEKTTALVREVQKDVISRHLLHIDFQKILMTEKIEVMVPLRLIGEAPGVKLSGGILEQLTREVKVLCLPKDIPSEITVDVSGLEIGQGILIKDLKSVPEIQVLSDPNFIVANIVAPTVLEETTPAAAPASTEPEVIAKGKKPEEGEAAAAPAAGGKTAEKGSTPQAKGAGQPAGK